jgi:hypothetical protein
MLFTPIVILVQIINMYMSFYRKCKCNVWNTFMLYTGCEVRTEKTDLNGK